MYKILLSAACVIALASCGNTASHEEHTPASGKTKIEIALTDLATTKDLVCEMEITEDILADTAVYEGNIYAFCHTGCKNEFLSNPASYLATK